VLTFLHQQNRKMTQLVMNGFTLCQSGDMRNKAFEAQWCGTVIQQQSI